MFFESSAPPRGRLATERGDVRGPSLPLHREWADGRRGGAAFPGALGLSFVLTRGGGMLVSGSRRRGRPGRASAPLPNPGPLTSRCS